MSERKPGEVLEEAATVLREQLSIAAAKASKVMAAFTEAARKNDE